MQTKPTSIPMFRVMTFSIITKNPSRPNGGFYWRHYTPENWKITHYAKRTAKAQVHYCDPDLFYCNQLTCWEAVCYFHCINSHCDHLLCWIERIPDHEINIPNMQAAIDLYTEEWYASQPQENRNGP